MKTFSPLPNEGLPKTHKSDYNTIITDDIVRKNLIKIIMCRRHSGIMAAGNAENKTVTSTLK